MNDTPWQLDWGPYAFLGAELEETKRDFNARISALHDMWRRRVLPDDEETIVVAMRGALVDSVAAAMARHAMRRVILLRAVRARVAQLQAFDK